MKKILIPVMLVCSLVSCDSTIIEEPVAVEAETLESEALSEVAESCLYSAYNLHVGLVSDGWCSASDPCGWDYIDEELRERFENCEYMTTAELCEMVEQIIERYPQYADTLGEDELFCEYEMLTRGE